MDIEFKEKALADLYEGKQSTNNRFKSNKKLVEKYIRTIDKLKNARRIEDLHQLRSLDYKKSIANRTGCSSVRIDGENRLVFEETTLVLDKREGIALVVIFLIGETKTPRMNLPKPLTQNTYLHDQHQEPNSRQTYPSRRNTA